jgi:hypothetical protein
MRSTLSWCLPDHHWWLRLATIPLIIAIGAAIVWWCAVAAQAWSWPAALAHLNVQVLLVAALWLASVLPNEILLLAQAWRRQRRRAAAVRGQRDAMPAAELPLPQLDETSLPLTEQGVFPKPDYSLATLGWHLVGFVGAIGLIAVSGGWLLAMIVAVVTGQMTNYAAYLHTIGTPVTPAQVTLGAAILFPFACVWGWSAHLPGRAVPFTLTIANDGIYWLPQGHHEAFMQWDELRSLEVAFAPHDPALPASHILVFVARGSRKAIWWPGRGSATALIARHSGLPITTLEPSMSPALPRAWHILSRNNSFQVLAGYLILIAAAVALVPPTAVGWLNAALGEVILGGAVIQLAAFTAFSINSTRRYRRVRRHPPLAELPPPPVDDGATYFIAYQFHALGRLLTFLAGPPLMLGFPLFVFWEIQATIGMSEAAVIVRVPLGIAVIPLSILGAVSMLRAVFGQSARYAVEVRPDEIVLRSLGRLGKRASVIINELAWSETERMLICVREGRIEGFRILGTEGQIVPWPAYRGRRVRRSDGGPPITAAALAALVAARSGHAPEVWDQTDDPSAGAYQALREARILSALPRP